MDRPTTELLTPMPSMKAYTIIDQWTEQYNTPADQEGAVFTAYDREMQRTGNSALALSKALEMVHTIAGVPIKVKEEEKTRVVRFVNLDKIPLQFPWPRWIKAVWVLGFLYLIWYFCSDSH